MALIVAPTVIIAIDDSVDTSIFYSITEEEETGKVKNVVSPYYLQPDGSSSYTELKKYQYIGYFFKTYPKPHLNLISPPPEINII